MLAVLAAALLLSLVAPGADARLPRAKVYRVGGPITLDTNLLSVSGVSAWAIDEYLKATTSLPPLGAAFLAAEQKYGINARFLLAAALHESGWGRSSIARRKHNLFGYNAYDRDPYRYANAYATYAANIDDTARFIRSSYLTRGGRYWLGQPTLRSMQQFWSSSHRWGVSVSRMATSLRLGSLAGRSIAFAAPVVSGPLHVGETASVEIGWTGRAIPAGVEFVATWEPIELDSEVTAAMPPLSSGDLGAVPAAAPPTSSPRPALGAPALDVPDPRAPTSIAARRVKTAPRSIRLAVPTPPETGDYMLDVEMRDSGSGPLPAAERVDIPSLEVRIWRDRAVSCDVEPSLDGTDAVVHITNTGRTTIPAASGRGLPTLPDAEVQVARSVVTVTVSAYDPVPVRMMVLASPLVADLEPGATIDVTVPGLAAATAGTPNWVSVDLSVLGDPDTLAVYPPVTAWLSGSEPVGTTAPATAPTASRTPTPRPTASATRPAAHVTKSYSEHSGSITYRGGWRDASNRSYLGGNVAWSRTPGSTATLTFKGSSVSWIGPVGPTRGLARVLVDGRAVARVDMWRSSFVAQRVRFTRSFASVGPHTLTIEVLSMPAHPYVAIDGFVVRS